MRSSRKTSPARRAPRLSGILPLHGAVHKRAADLSAALCCHTAITLLYILAEQLRAVA